MYQVRKGETHQPPTPCLVDSRRSLVKVYPRERSNATRGRGAMTTIDNIARADTSRPSQSPVDDSGESVLARLGLRFTNWAERWFPDAYVFVSLAVAVVAVAALLNGASSVTVAKSFGDGFWSLITFTMQMAMIVISGYVVASSPPAATLI